MRPTFLSLFSGAGGLDLGLHRAGWTVTYGGGKRPTTSRCTGCGRRDAFRNEHDCTPGASWRTEVVDTYAAPLPLVREMAGHRDNTTTLDVYTGVLLDEPADRLTALRTAVGRMTGLNRGVPVGPHTMETTIENPDSSGFVSDGGYRDRSLAALPDPASLTGMPASGGEPDAPNRP